MKARRDELEDVADHPAARPTSRPAAWSRSTAGCRGGPRDGCSSLLLLLALALDIQGELTRMEGLAKTLSGENAAEAKRLAANLRKKLQRTKEELDKARMEQTRK